MQQQDVGRSEPGAGRLLDAQEDTWPAVEPPVAQYPSPWRWAQA